MKTRIIAAARAGWTFLTVIPGWPDAGKFGRTLYALPLVLPLLGLLVLAGWLQFVRGPHMQAERLAHRPALMLEAEIAALRLECSDAQAADSAAATALLAGALIQSQADFDAQLEAIRAAASTASWVATLHATDLDNEAPGEPAALLYRNVRARLVPAATNPAPFASLLGLLDQLPPAGKSAGVTRLTVRADDQARLSAEFTVRYTLRPAR